MLVIESSSLFGGFLFHPCLAKGAQQFLNDIQLLIKLCHRNSAVLGWINSVSWFSFRAELHRMCGRVSRQTCCHPSGFLSMHLFYICSEVKEFGSEMSEWKQPAALRQQRCLLYAYGIKRSSNHQTLLLVHPFGLLHFFLLQSDCWSSLNKVYHLIQTFRVGVRTSEYLPYSFWVESKSGWHLFARFGWLQFKLMVDGNVMNSWSGSTDCQNTHGVQP